MKRTTLIAAAASTILAGVGSIVTAPDAHARPMNLTNFEQIEPPDGQGGTNAAVYCEAIDVPVGYKTYVEVANGATYNLYGWQVSESAVSSPVNAASWARTGAAEGPQDRRITWCHVRPDGKVQVQTRDGSNFLITGLTVG